MGNIVYDFSETFLNQNKSKNVNNVTYRDIDVENIVDRPVLKNRGNVDEFEYHKIEDLIPNRIDKEAVNGCLRNLMTFKPGDYILNPDFGNTLYQYLYEPVSGYAAEKVSYTLREMIRNWEPRISIIDMKITPDVDNNQYHINMYYQIPSLNDQNVNEFEYSLQGSLATTA